MWAIALTARNSGPLDSRTSAWCQPDLNEGTLSPRAPSSLQGFSQVSALA
jgi:hypothetical protein